MDFFYKKNPKWVQVFVIPGPNSKRLSIKLPKTPFILYYYLKNPTSSHIPHSAPIHFSHSLTLLSLSRSLSHPLLPLSLTYGLNLKLWLLSLTVAITRSHRRPQALSPPVSRSSQVCFSISLSSLSSDLSSPSVAQPRSSTAMISPFLFFF